MIDVAMISETKIKMHKSRTLVNVTADDHLSVIFLKIEIQNFKEQLQNFTSVHV